MRRVRLSKHANDFVPKRKMDIQKLKPTQGQWREQLLTTAEGRARTHVTATPRVKSPAPPPEGRGGALWHRFYNDAILRGFNDPEKMADASLRARERALALKACRSKVLMTTHTPLSSETVAKTKKSKVLVQDAFRCKARTLEGRQCTFKATCGSFCKKHAPPE